MIFSDTTNNSGYNYNTTDNTYVGRFGYRGNSQFAPLSAWSYFGYTILFSIPLVGFICMIVFSVSDKNINRRSFARSFLITMVIAIVLIVILSVTGGLAALQYANYYNY